MSRTFEVYFAPKRMGELIFLTGSFQAEKVVACEVLAQLGIITAKTSLS